MRHIKLVFTDREFAKLFRAKIKAKKSSWANFFMHLVNNQVVEDE